jgi:hypothetical protein
MALPSLQPIHNTFTIPPAKPSGGNFERIPDCPYLLYRDSRPAVQMRLLAQTLLIYRPTITTEDYLYIQRAVLYAAYWHLEIVTLDKWSGAAGIVRALAKQHGVKVVLCKTLKQAINSADLKDFKE